MFRLLRLLLCFVFTASISSAWSQPINIDRGNIDKLIAKFETYDVKFFTQDKWMEFRQNSVAVLYKESYYVDVDHGKRSKYFTNEPGHNSTHKISFECNYPVISAFSIKYNWLRLNDPSSPLADKVYSLYPYISSYTLDCTIRTEIKVYEKTGTEYVDAGWSEKERVSLSPYQASNFRPDYFSCNSGNWSYNGNSGRSLGMSLKTTAPEYETLGDISPPPVREEYIDDVKFTFNEYNWIATLGSIDRQFNGVFMDFVDNFMQKNTNSKISMEQSGSLSGKEDSGQEKIPQVNHSANVADYSKSKPVYGQEWLNGELQRQQQIAQSTQYAAAQISGLINNILVGEQRRQQFQEMVSGLTSISYNSYDPAELMGEYKAKTEELNVAYNQQAEETTMQMAAYLENVNANVSGENASVQVAANNLGAMIAINSARKQIYEEKARKEEELEENLKKAMESLKSDVLQDIEKSLNESYDDALKALDPNLEAYFHQQYLCMDCMKKEINRDFYYKSSEWLNTSCTQPRKPGIYKDLPPNASTCLAAAESKYNIYRKYNDQNFLQASRSLANSSLAYNKNNPNAYYLKSILANNTIDALTNIKIAKNLDPQSQIISNRLKTIEKEFNFWFFESLKADNLTNITEAVKFKYHLGLLNEQGLSPIEYSINIDNARVCRILFENEIDEAKTLKVNGYNYLFYAARKDANECFHLLTSKGLGADVIPDDNTTNAITIAASSQSFNILKDLIRRGVDLDKQLKTYKEQELFFELSVLGRVYTEYAIENNRVDLMVPLAEYHPGVFKDQALSEPLRLVEYTLKNDNERVLEKFIVFGWNPTEEKDIIESCFEHRSVECLDFLLNYFSKEDFSYLDGNLFHFAVSRNTADMVPVIFKHNIDVNQLDQSGNTPLTHAVLEGRDDCVQALIQSKAKPDQKNEKGWAPLHIAAKYNQLANCKYLCEGGADVNLEGDKKFTPLHYAAMENNAELCNALLASGASRNAKDDWGRTPYDIVKERKHLDLYKILK